MGQLAAQVETDVPPVVSGAKSVAVERIKVHSAALANAPPALIDQCIDNLREYRAIAIDIVDKDGLKTDAAKLHDVLDKYNIANSFEIYSGTHTSAMADRIQNHVLPFSRSLCFGAPCD